MMAKRGRQYEVQMPQASRETLNRPFGHLPRTGPLFPPKVLPNSSRKHPTAPEPGGEFASWTTVFGASPSLWRFRRGSLDQLNADLPAGDGADSSCPIAVIAGAIRPELTKHTFCAFAAVGVA